MPLTSPPRKVSETENMLRLLLSVDALESLTPAQLWTFVAEQELMDYVAMRLCLHKLLAAGELETGEGALSEQLLLTDRGREALTLFGERLPSDVHERVGKAAPEYRQRVARTRQVQAVYEMARPKDYRLNLSVCEGDLPTIRLRLETDNRTLASKAIHRFSAHAAEVTTYLYALAEQAVRNAPPPSEALALPADSITEHSATEYSAKAVLTGKHSQIGVSLLLPTRGAAEAFVQALSTPDGAAAAAKRLTELISGAIRKRKA